MQKSRVKSQRYKLKFKNIRFVVFSFLIVIFNFSFLIFNCEKVEASTFSAGVYPPVIKINAISPVSLKTPIIVTNPTDQTINLDISFRPFTQSDDENGQIRFLTSEELDLKDPLIFQRIKVMDGKNQVADIEIAPKQQKELSVEIDIPDNEPASDYYFSILFTSSTPQSEAKKNKSTILTSVATNILLSIGKPTKSKAEIAEFSTPFFVNKGPVEFKLKVSNPGNQFISAGGTILIKNLFGQTIGRVDLKKATILANTSRFITSGSQTSSVLWPEKLLVGPYTATLSLTLSDNSTEIKENIFFFGAPLQTAAISLIVIVAIFIIQSKLRTRLKR